MAAETIRIEIPIEAKDNTSGGVKSAQKNISKLDKIMDQMQDKLSRIIKGAYNIDIGVHDSATEKIASIEDAAGSIGRAGSVIDVEANDSATGVISEVEDAAAKLNGENATVEAQADDAASEVLSDVGDAVANLDGETAVVHVETDTSGIDQIANSGGGGGGGSGGLGDLALGGAAMGAAKSGAGYIKAAAAFGGLSLGVGSAINTFMAFEAGMSQVEAISGATASQMDQLTAKALEMGAKTKFTATQSAEAFKYMGMAGWGAEAMLAGIEPIMNLAAASGEDLGTVSDIVTDSLTAFGMTADDTGKYVDILAQASRKSNTDVSMMGESFKYAAPVAGAMGYTASDVAIALGLMANAGIKGSQAGTTLRRALSNLASPSKTTATAMEKYGIKLTDDYGKMKSLQELMTDFRTNLGGLSEAEQAAAASDLFGTNAMAGMLAIINAEDDAFNDLIHDIEHSTGVAGMMSETMMDNLQGSLTLLSSAFDGVQMSVGSGFTPYIRILADGLTGSMPLISKAIDDLFGTADGSLQLKIWGVMGTLKKNLSDMISSEEWQNADTIGKINIAWDTIIGGPLMDWASNEGGNLIGGAITAMFESAGNVLSGEGQLTDWIGFGALIKVTETAVEKVGAVKGAIQDLAIAKGVPLDMAGAFGATVVAIGLAAAAAYGLKAIIDSINSEKIEENLKAHFGSIQLTPEQVSEAASLIVPEATVQIAKLNVASVEFSSAEDFKSKAEAALQGLDFITWKAKVKGQLPDTVQAEAFENLETFKESVKGALEKEEYAAELSVKAILGEGSDTTELITKMQGWFKEDSAQMDAVSGALTELLEGQITKGVSDINVETAASILQAKMLELANGQGAARQKAFMDMLSLQTSGKELTVESFQAVVGQIDSYIAEQRSAENSTYQSLLEYFAGAVQKGHLGDSEYQDIMSMIGTSIDNSQVRSLAQEWEWISQTIQDTYGSELDKAKVGLQESSQSLFDTVGTMLKNGESSGLSVLLDDLTTEVFGGLSGEEQGALGRLYETMIPNVQQMRDLIDKATAEGEKVPRALMDSYNEAMTIGAASGDGEALYAYFANQIKNSEGGIEAFRKSMTDVGVDLATVFPDLNQALIRAAAEVTDQGDYSEIWGSVLEGIANAGGEADSAAIQQIINDALAGSGYEMDFETGKLVVHPGEVDTSEVGEAIQEATDSDPVDAAANVTVTSSETDPEEAYQEAVEETDTRFDDPIETDAQADVTAEQTNNAEEVYSAVDQALKTAFATAFDVPATAIVKVTWQLQNGTNSVSVSGGGSGSSASFSASLAHSAVGRYVDGFMVSTLGEDGPEYVIPVGTGYRDRGLDLWEQAGHDLGVPGFAEGGIVGGTPNYSQYLHSGSSGGTSSNNDIQVNLAPNITVNGAGDAQQVAEEVRRAILASTDDIAANLGRRMQEAYANTPR